MLIYLFQYKDMNNPYTIITNCVYLLRRIIYLGMSVGMQVSTVPCVYSLIDVRLIAISLILVQLKTFDMSSEC